MRIATLIIAVIGAVLSIGCATLDGGNVDFYWKPISAVWYIISAVAIVRPKSTRASYFLSRAWWLQIIFPIAALFLSMGLVRIHKPYPAPEPRTHAVIGG